MTLGILMTYQSKLIVQMTPEPNFKDMSFKTFTVNEHSTKDPELDPDTIFFLKYFFR